MWLCYYLYWQLYDYIIKQCVTFASSAQMGLFMTRVFSNGVEIYKKFKCLMTCKRILANTIFTNLEFCFLGKHCPRDSIINFSTFGEVQQVSGFYASYRESQSSNSLVRHCFKCDMHGSSSVSPWAKMQTLLYKSKTQWDWIIRYIKNFMFLGKMKSSCGVTRSTLLIVIINGLPFL